MSNFGLSVVSFGKELPINEEYRNLVLFKTDKTYVTTGIIDIHFLTSGSPTLEVAVRHPGLTVGLLSYLKDSGGIYGARLYVVGTGYIYWKAFVRMYPINLTGTGLVVFSSSGEQTFNSNHIYADIFKSVPALDKSVWIGGSFYFLCSPSLVKTDYKSVVNSYQISRYGYKVVNVYIMKSKTETKTFDVNGTEENITYTRVYKQKQSKSLTNSIFGSYAYYRFYYMSKSLVGVSQVGGYIDKASLSLVNDANVYIQSAGGGNSPSDEEGSYMHFNFIAGTDLDISVGGQSSPVICVK